MAWTYDVSQLAGNKLFQVRWHVADTNVNDQLALDEEIELALSTAGGNVFRAASTVCNAIALKYGREMDTKGDTQFFAREKYEQYKQMATEFAEKAKTTGAATLFGGGNLSRSPSFTTSLHTTPQDETEGV